MSSSEAKTCQRGQLFLIMRVFVHFCLDLHAFSISYCGKTGTFQRLSRAKWEYSNVLEMSREGLVPLASICQNEHSYTNPLRVPLSYVPMDSHTPRLQNCLVECLQCRTDCFLIMPSQTNGLILGLSLLIFSDTIVEESSGAKKI